MWLLLAQLAKEKQTAAQAAIRSAAELARPRIIPIPVTGTIEFERGQIVAKMGEGKRSSEWIISTELCFAQSRRAERMAGGTRQFPIWRARSKFQRFFLLLSRGTFTLAFFQVRLRFVLYRLSRVDPMEWAFPPSLVLGWCG